MDSTTVSLSGNDTLNVGGRVLTDFADGDFAELSFPNELMKVKTGKNGNSIFAFDSTGLQCDLKVRVIRGSSDDAYLNSIISRLKFDPARFVLVQGQLVKRIGDGQGNISHDSYLVGGGVPTKQVGGKSNAEGDTEQSVSIYEFKFTNTSRNLL
jgi:hypothetical protein